MLHANVVQSAHELVRNRLRPGDAAIDATVGNGYDTQMLAEQVGPLGRVLGFDIQAAALTTTASRLARAGVEDRVILVHGSHEALANHLGAVAHRPLRVAMFNFGYLPGSDKAVTTQPSSSLPALTAALDALLPGGLLTAVLYWGHEGGAAEATAILNWAGALSSARYQAQHVRTVNRRNPPTLLAVDVG